MASCDVNALMADAACFACLDAYGRDLVELALLAQAAGTPGVVPAIDGRVAATDAYERSILELQILCNLSGGT
jgi:hypothetical protein